MTAREPLVRCPWSVGVTRLPAKGTREREIHDRLLCARRDVRKAVAQLPALTMTGDERAMLNEEACDVLDAISELRRLLAKAGNSQSVPRP